MLYFSEIKDLLCLLFFLETDGNIHDYHSDVIDIARDGVDTETYLMECQQSAHSNGNISP